MPLNLLITANYSKVLSLIVLLIGSVELYAQRLPDTIPPLPELQSRLDQARDLKDHKLLGETYYFMALHEEYFNHNLRTSFDYLIRSRERFALINDSTSMYKVDGQIARRNFQTELYAESLDTYLEMLEYYQRKKMQEEITHTLFHISEVYKAKGDIDLEYAYLNKAIEQNKVLNDTILMISILLEKIDNYERLNELDSALIISKDVFEMSKASNDRMGISRSLFEIGYINKKMGNFERAVKYLQNALDVNKYKPYDTYRLSIYGELGSVYALMDNYKRAFEYENKYTKLNDSILDQNRIEASYNYARKYEALQNQKNIESLKIDQKWAVKTNDQQRRAMYVLAGLLGILLLLLYYVIRFYSQQIKTEKIINNQQKEIDTQRIKELENEIQINSMKSMIEGQEKERERIAKDLHDSLGGLLSTVKLQFDSEHITPDLKRNENFVKAHELLDHAVTEVRSISQNLQPSALANLGLEAALRDLVNRFRGPLYPEIDLQCYDLPKDINQMSALSIYRVLQEMLHNAIKHAQADEILIQINRQGDELVIQFEDDGVGFEASKLKHKGMGLNNIKSRIDYLKGTVEMDSREGEGTSYIIHVNWK